jgi:hypothetical protein
MFLRNLATTLHGTSTLSNDQFVTSGASQRTPVDSLTTCFCEAYRVCRVPSMFTQAPWCVRTPLHKSCPQGLKARGLQSPIACPYPLGKLLLSLGL